MRSARPTSGASSTEPCSGISSTGRSRSAKNDSARPRELRRDAQERRKRRAFVIPVDAPCRDDEPAVAEAEVGELRDVAVGLPQHVLADDAAVGRAELDVGRHVGRAQKHSVVPSLVVTVSLRPTSSGTSIPAARSRAAASSYSAPFGTATVSESPFTPGALLTTLSP